MMVIAFKPGDLVKIKEGTPWRATVLEGGGEEGILYEALPTVGMVLGKRLDKDLCFSNQYRVLFGDKVVLEPVFNLKPITGEEEGKDGR